MENQKAEMNAGKGKLDWCAILETFRQPTLNMPSSLFSCSGEEGEADATSEAEKMPPFLLKEPRTLVT